MVVAPGAYDCITAVMIQRAGFEAVYMTGAGTSASLGYPDFGLITMSEMVANAGRIATAVDRPVIADADTGYGNELNVVRTVREYEKAGVAAIHLEDQEFPKKCGHLDDKRIVPREDWYAKIRAAASAKRSADFTVIARTDSRAVAGFDEAVARAKGALAAGADMIFLEAPQTMEEVQSVPRLVGGPCLLNMVRGGKSPSVSVEQAQAAGYRLAIVPGLLLGAVISGCQRVLNDLRPAPEAATTGGSPRDFFRLFGADEWDEYRTRFRDPAKASEAAE
jgi:2-methylisocitrate lyase-like PEP mutase family enzyme